MKRTKGRLPDCPLPRLLVEAADSRATGALTVRVGGARRVLAFREGKLVGMLRPPEGSVEAEAVVAELGAIAAATDGGYDWSGTLPDDASDGSSRDAVGLAIQLLLEKSPMEHVGKEIYALGAPMRCDPVRIGLLAAHASAAEQAALREVVAPLGATEIVARLGAGERSRRLVVAAALVGALAGGGSTRPAGIGSGGARPGVEPLPSKPAARPGVEPLPSKPPAARPGVEPLPSKPPAARPGVEPLPSKPAARPGVEPLPSKPPARPGVEALPSKPPSGGAASAAAPAPAPELARISTEELRDFVVAKRRSLAQSNHYQVMEVPRDAPRRVIEEHYLRFLKRYHPDAYYGDMDPETKDGIEEIFFRLNEAYNALIHTEKRMEYDRLLAEGKVGRTQLSEEELLMAKQQAEIGRRSLLEGDWLSARSSLDAARRLNPEDAEVLANLGKAYLEGGVANRMPDLAFELLQRAIEIEPYRATFHASMGDYWRVKGDKTKAASFYQEALKLEPELPGVERSLREVGGTKDGGGILGSLFKKKG